MVHVILAFTDDVHKIITNLYLNLFGEQLSLPDLNI